MANNKYIDTFGLSALSPLDGRYRNKLNDLASLMSESSLIRKRIFVELSWLDYLLEQPEIGEFVPISSEEKAILADLLKHLPEDAEQHVKLYEAKTNHDVKAVEYYLRDLLDSRGFGDSSLALIHFACTSEDINNLAYASILKEAREVITSRGMNDILFTLRSFAEEWADVPMLSRTHGQTASPTTVGKEFVVFYHRLKKIHDSLMQLPIEGKLNGAVGNYNAHYIAYPQIKWMDLSKKFIEQRLGLVQNPITTQIENHDSMVLMIDTVRRFNTVLLGLCKDMWSYISIDYFKLAKKAEEVGSSTMPHKVNPIDFENSEGNLGLANSLAQHLADKLPVSRWQRDLSDSTVQRSLGSFFGYSLLAYRSLLAGLEKVHPNRDVIASDLNNSWEVLAEAVQTVMRRYGCKDAYERLKTQTRGQTVNRQALISLIDETCELPPETKQRLKSLKPEDYTGIAQQLAKFYSKET